LAGFCTKRSLSGGWGILNAVTDRSMVPRGNRAREKATVLTFERRDTACRGKNHLSPLPILSKASSLMEE